jgi:hypothetical protein
MMLSISASLLNTSLKVRADPEMFTSFSVMAVSLLGAMSGGSHSHDH